MAYKRVTQTERRLIHRWRQEGHGIREIARRLGRAPSTISREIKRNIGKRGYRPKQAHERALSHARRPGPRRFTDEVKAYAEAKLRLGWTPEIIAGRTRFQGLPSVCKETIYRHIYADAKSDGDLWTHLPRARRRRRRRCPRGDRRGRIPNQRMIDERPPEVAARQTLGHWEGDLVAGGSGTGHLVTLVERATRFTLAGRVEAARADVVAEEICRQFERLPAATSRTLTLDNGKEFTRHERIARETELSIFFAHPYHAWERGTNEQTNGLILRLHPKGSSFHAIDETALGRIENVPAACFEIWLKLWAFLL
jgi:IS30 family transposase